MSPRFLEVRAVPRAALLLGLLAATIAMAAAVTAGLRVSRARDRQCGDARGEE